MIPYLSGVVLALVTCAFAMFIGLDRDRAFYPTVLVVNGSYYVLFAVMGAATRALYVDSLITIVFVLIASFGFKRSSWLVVAGLAAHGLLDLCHNSVVSNPGVPSWWPAFCMTYDLSAAAFLAWTLLRSPLLSKPRAGNAP